MTRTTRSAIAAALTALAAPAAAQAHVTVQPDRATAGAYTVESIRVPNETDDATTTKIAVRLPPGFASVAYEAIPGWTAKLKSSKVATPIKTDDGEVDEQVDQITFTAKKGAGIAPGQFQDFPLSVKLPDAPGKLTFKAVQTYDNGDVVRWIGAPDAEEPAPQLTTTAATAAAGGSDAHGETATAATKPTVAATPAAAAPAASDDGTDALTIVALLVGGLGLIAGLGGLAAARRRPAAA